MANRIGQQLGNYRLTRLLGAGGFAEVYLAEHIHLDTLAAIKVLHSQLTSEDVEQFRAEARTLARLVHPQIVRLLDFGIEGNTPYLVMDYAPSGTFRQRHPRGAALPLSTIVPYVSQVAEALQYAHDEKLIHRDIKPENMLLGRRNEVLLSDFGIATISRTTRSQSVQDITGTVSYMAPEQLQGRPGRASDQYSLGIVVYEWLSGDVPFHGAFIEVASQHMLVPPPPLREKVPMLLPEVEQVVMRALEKESQKRFGSVREFAQALASAVEKVHQATYSPTEIRSSAPIIPSTASARPRTPTKSPASKPISPNRVTSIAHKSPEEWLEEGNAHYNAGRYQEAIAAYDSAITLDPMYIDAYNNRGWTHYELEKYQKAIADYSSAIELNPNFCWPYNNRGLAYADLDQYQRAIVDYNKAIELDPNEATAYYNRGDAYYALKEYEKAIADYDCALQLNPHEAVVYHNRGEAYSELGNYEEATADYNRSIQLDPSFAIAYFNRGEAYRILKNYQRAIADCNRALELDPKHALSYGTRGQAYASLKQYQRAILDFDRALELNPNYTWAKDRREEAYHALKAQ
jgi:serine/threonine protein kinase